MVTTNTPEPPRSPKIGPGRASVLSLLGVLMVSHLSFLGYTAKACNDLAKRSPIDKLPTCLNSNDAFQKASETYVAILLALMAPLHSSSN